MMKQYEFKSAISDELTMFMEFCEKSYAAQTYRMYRAHMESLDRFLYDNDFDGEFLPAELVDKWIASLQGLKDFSISGYVTALKCFLRFRIGLGKGGYIPPNRKKTYDYTPYIFSDDEVSRICDIADNYEVRYNNRLPYIQLELPMVIRILCGCGTRLGETLSIKVADVDLERHVLTLRATKWDKERLVPMHHNLGDILEKYCMAMGLIGKPEAYLFPRHDFSDHLEQYDMRNRFNLILRLANISLEGRSFQERGPCMHCLRHRFVFRAFRQLEALGIRVDDAVPVLSVYLGHYDLSETEKYMKFSAMLFPEELEKFDSFSEGFFPDPGEVSP